MPYIGLSLARGRIDRDELTRNDPRALAAARLSPQARYLLVAGDSVAINPNAQGRLLFLERREATQWNAHDAAYLGRDGEHYYFGCDITDLVPSDDVLPADFPQLRPVRLWAHEWADLDTALAVGAVAILNWRRVTHFCPRCGEELEQRFTGWDMACPAGHQVFPRIDPAVIMAIHDPDDRLLLGRNSAWGPGRYSVLAGFVEAGETLEAAVRREVFEETHIRVDRVDYYGSQPWPFPRSLMLAFDGWTEQGESELAVDGKEMAHAHFFARDEFCQQLRAGEIRMPTPTSVAASLVQAWLGRSFAEVMAGR